MSISLIVLIGSVLTLVCMAGVFRIEDAREGRLLCFVKIRLAINTLVCFSTQKLQNIETYLGKGFIRLIFHYIVHGILYKILQWTTGVEKRVENLLRRNKQIAKKIKTNKEKNHLDKIAEHKQEVALTEAQKVKLRSHE